MRLKAYWLYVAFIKIMQEWRKAIKKPIAYSIVPGNYSGANRNQTNFVTFVIVLGGCLLLVLYYLIPSSSSLQSLNDEHGHVHGGPGLFASSCSPLFVYNNTYPLSSVEPLNDGTLKYRIAAVADLDKKSRLELNKNQWSSYLMYGHLLVDPVSYKVQLTWDSGEEELHSEYSSGGRGMELSELVAFNGKLYTCDDRTGIVYEIRDNQVLPWAILSNGNGLNKNPFKCEWMTVKDEHMYVGGLGKEWTSPAGDVVINHDPQWVKRISPLGQIEHLDWRLRYIGLKKAAGITPPGYLIHEAAVWSNLHNKWYFLPRRASNQAYDELLDERRGTNLVLEANNDFTDISLTAKIDPLVKTHGFSSVKILPVPREIELKPKGSEIIVALKSEEDNDTIRTYITIFRLPDGHVLLPPTQLSGEHKYEGVEFV